MPPLPRFSASEKADMLAVARAQLRSGAKRKDIALRLGINIASLSGWLREETLDRLLPPKPPTMPRVRATRSA